MKSVWMITKLFSPLFAHHESLKWKKTREQIALGRAEKKDENSLNMALQPCNF